MKLYLIVTVYIGSSGSVSRVFVGTGQGLLEPIPAYTIKPWRLDQTCSATIQNKKYYKIAKLQVSRSSFQGKDLVNSNVHLSALPHYDLTFVPK